MSEASGAPELAEAPHYHGHRERLRERFLKAGRAALADCEPLELVLFRAMPRRDVKPYAKALRQRFGSFAETIAAPINRLTEVKGIGEAAALELKIVEAAARRLARTVIDERRALDSWTKLIEYYRTTMAFADKESTYRRRFYEKLFDSNVLCRSLEVSSNICPISSHKQRWTRVRIGKKKSWFTPLIGRLQGPGLDRWYFQRRSLAALTST